MAGGPLHHRRPHDGLRAPAAAQRRRPDTIPKHLRAREARGIAACVPEGLVRPARRVPRARTARRSSMSYVDGFIVPLPKGKEDEYRQLAETFARKAKDQGALGTIEA